MTVGVVGRPILTNTELIQRYIVNLHNYEGTGMRRLDIAIAGAGPAGLATAAFLAQDQHRVRIFERFETPRAIGAGLMLQPTGLACLARLGLDRSIIDWGARIEGIDGRTHVGGRIFNVRYAAAGAHLFGLGIHRGALFHVLYEEVKRLGIEIVSGVEVPGSEEAAGGRFVIDRKGQRHGPFDLVVDASGMRSQIRATLGQVKTDRPYTYGALWAIVELPDDWPTTTLLTQVYHRAHTMAGVLPVGRAPGDSRRLAALFWSLRHRDYAAWKAAGMDAWKARVLDVWPDTAPLLAQLKSSDDLTLATYADMMLKVRVGSRLAFVGDAGRTTSPQLGQGCNLSLIDAMMLASALRESGDLSGALGHYAALRGRHSSFYSRASRWLTPFFQSDSVVASAVRDVAFPVMGVVPFLQREMVRTLAGMKTGLFSHLDPGDWHPDYALVPPLARVNVPA